MKSRTNELDLIRLVLGPTETNGYILAINGEAAVIDPAWEPRRVAKILFEKKLNLRYIINTHGHYDHICGNGLMKMVNPEPILAIHKDDAQFLSLPDMNLSVFFGEPYLSPGPGLCLNGGEALPLGHLKLEILHTPGHTPGSICILVDGYIFAGDLVFAEGIGRTDLPGGNEEALYNSIKQVLSIQGNARVLPGHGPETTLDEQRRINSSIYG